MTGSHFDKLLAILDRQPDDRLNPNMLIGYLGLINLMSIMSVVHSSADADGFQIPVTSSADITKSLGDEKNLKNTISALMSGVGGNSGAPDLSGLLGMMGGNKKPSPQLLLTLMNLMNSMKSKNDNAGETEFVDEEKEDNDKTNRSEVKGVKKRML